MHDDAKYREAVEELQTQGPSKGSAWRHASTGGLYFVTDHAVRESDLTPGVVYHAAGGPFSVGWWRPLAEFTDGRFVPTV